VANTGKPASGLSSLGQLTELKQRMPFVVGALIVFRFGTFIPVPGVDPEAMIRLMDTQRGTIVDLFNMFSGGALQRMSVFALNVVPYISASIIIQLMAQVMPSLQALYRDFGSRGFRVVAVSVDVPDVGDLVLLQITLYALTVVDQTVFVAAGEPQQFELLLGLFRMGNQFLGRLGFLEPGFRPRPDVAVHRLERCAVAVDPAERRRFGIGLSRRLNANEDQCRREKRFLHG